LPFLALTLLFQTGCWQGSVLSDDNMKVQLDPAGHAQYIQMPTDAALTILEVFALGSANGLNSGYTPYAATPMDQIQVSGPFPFVTVTGPLNSDGSFSLTGTGTVAGYQNVAVTLTGTVDPTGKITAQYAMGTNGALPSGQSITYSMTGQVRIPAGTPLISPTPGLLQFATNVGSNPANKPLTIANGGTGGLGWSATVSTDSGGNWLAIDTIAAVAPSNINAGVKSANLAAGNYTGKITIVGVPQGGVPNSPLSVPVQLAVGTPQVSSGGVVNVASYNLVSSSVAPGSIAAVFGFNLTDNTVCSPPNCGPSFDPSNKVIPTMASAQITFNNIPAPILSTPGSGQINVQVPVELAGATSATVVVTQKGQPSLSTTVPIAPVSPGLISIDASGKNQGAILNDKDANLGIQSLAAPSASAPNAHPATAGDVIELYATGLGAVQPAVATGMRPSGLPATVAAPTVTIGGIDAPVVFSGLAGCCVGLNQINVKVPPGVTPGSAVPVVLTIGGIKSNTVTIAVQ
jgi:uncharacterized protein (TIGR03437 family)